MNHHHNRCRLLEDALFPASLTDSLAATRRAARGRRIRRRVTGAGTAALCLALTAAWIFQALPRSEVRRQEMAREAMPGFILITNRTQPPSTVVRTAAAPAGLIVTTGTAPASISQASRDEVFAFAGGRPGGMIHLADGTSHWIWLDVPELAVGGPRHE